MNWQTVSANKSGGKSRNQGKLKMKGPKLTNQQLLSKRKFKIPNRLFNWFYHLIMADIELGKHNSEIIYEDDIRKEKGPGFIIWNHLSRLDHAYISKATYPNRFSMVAAYNEFFRSHLAMVFKMMNILPKKNFCVDILGLKAMLSIIRKGGWVSLAPEGMATVTGYNERILPGIGSLLKKCKVPVYFFEFRGQSLAAPVFSPYYRYGGKTVVTVRRLFDGSQLETMSEEKIEEIIQTAVDNDDYAWQAENRFKWNTKGKGCERMHEVCYKCPDCGKEFDMLGSGDEISCSACGFKIHMNEFLAFEPNRTPALYAPEYLSDWAIWERKSVIKEIRDNPDFSFRHHVKIGNIPTDHYVKSKELSSEIVGEGEMTLDHNGIHYVGTRNGQPYRFDLSYKTYCRLCENINTRLFCLYIDDEYFDILPDEPVAVKMDFIVQEMHRLHFNTWKPVKAHEYLYKDI